LEARTNNFMQALLFPPPKSLSLSLSLSLSQKVDIFGNDRPEFAPISSHKIWVTLHQGNALEHEKREREKRGGFHFILILATCIYLLIYITKRSFLELLRARYYHHHHQSLE